ncbi:MAG: L-threonylcarbamoyladenylate synthase, partial [Lachnospiraceae bacterium]|nr:L-threonylcarbamoyladenylate synthase [Lachnospiraceae bacterium]
VRMPNHRTALELIKAAGGFVAAPSANLSGRPSPTISKYVAEDMDGRIDMIIDGGETRIGLESTIIDLSGSKPEILRPGFVTKEMIENVIGSRCAYTVDEDIKNTPPRAPGMKYRHYAPKGLITVVIGSEEEVVSYINEQIVSDRSAGKITGVIATEKTKNLYSADRVKNIGDESSDEEIAHNLYRILREFDDEVTDVIYSEGFNISGIGQATMNRLLKAASNKIIEVR